MHDIGRIALVTSMPQAYEQVVERGADGPADLLRAERELCGLDHCQAGRALVAAWGLPEAFLEITSCHHDPAPGVAGTASVLPLSCRLADDLGFGVLNYRNPRSYADIVEAFPERARSVFPDDGDELAQEIANAIKLIESA
jgi:HD-like signal output (HDOD) protein